MNRVVGLIAIFLLLVGCKKDNSSLEDSSLFDSSSTSISFANSADNWSTKGSVYGADNIGDMMVYAYYTSTSYWANASSVESFMYNQKVARDYDAFNNSYLDTWSYSPLKYWPNNDSEKITFYSFSPYGADIEVSYDSDSKPLFTYTLSQFSQYNDDLTAGVAYDCTKNSSGVDFDMEHALTRISISARTTNAPSEGDNGEYNVKYSVNGITFFGIQSKGDLSFDESGDISWSPTSTISTVDLTATQGNTLKAYDDQTLLDYDSSTDTSDQYTEISMGGMSMFVLPQNFKDLTTPPTVEMRVRKTYDMYDDEEDPNHLTPISHEMFYSTKAVEIPTYSSDADGNKTWEIGQWLNMQFSFDVEDPDNSMPMSVVSVVYQWTEVDLDIDVHPNIYIYSDTNGTIDATGQSTAEMMFCTNYEYDMRVAQQKFELDGSATTARGFMFITASGTTYVPILLDASDNDAELTYSYESDGDLMINGVKVTYDTNGDPILTQYEDANGNLKFKIKIADTYSFTYTVEKSNRKDKGLYTSTVVSGDSYGVNKEDDDAVYILTLNIEDSHLDSNGDFAGTISVEMLSNAGGLITADFPITLHKDLTTTN
ncbi:MAG: fimbrillin family protein [Rikenellaceae bacterium]